MAMITEEEIKNMQKQLEKLPRKIKETEKSIKQQEKNLELIKRFHKKPSRKGSQ